MLAKGYMNNLQTVAQIIATNCKVKKAEVKPYLALTGTGLTLSVSTAWDVERTENAGIDIFAKNKVTETLTAVEQLSVSVQAGA